MTGTKDQETNPRSFPSRWRQNLIKGHSFLKRHESGETLVSIAKNCGISSTYVATLIKLAKSFKIDDPYVRGWSTCDQELWKVRNHWYGAVADDWRPGDGIIAFLSSPRS